MKANPPERNPEQFEKIRDAFEKCRDPRQRAKAVLECPEAGKPLVSLLDGLKPRRSFAGPQAWREALKNR